MLERPTPPPPKPRRDARPPAAGRRQKPEPRPEGNASSSSSSSPPPAPRAPPPACSASPSANAGGGEGNLDRVLLDNFAEMVPLIETLMGQRTNPSFRRRASVIYTPAPSNPKKAAGNKSMTSSSAKKRREDDIQGKQMAGDKQDIDDNEFSIMSSRPLAAAECTQRDREEMVMLREQVDVLNKNLIEKDEKLKAVESSLSELKHEMVEKDALIKSAHSQLNNAKIKLADKQAALEKIEWEAREASKNNMKLQGKLDCIDFEISSFMKLFLELSVAPSVPSFEDDMTYVHDFEQLPNLDIDESAMEEARMAYIDALAAAKANPCDEMLRITSEARLKLQSFVL